MSIKTLLNKLFNKEKPQIRGFFKKILAELEAGEFEEASKVSSYLYSLKKIPSIKIDVSCAYLSINNLEIRLTDIERCAVYRWWHTRLNIVSETQQLKIIAELEALCANL